MANKCLCDGCGIELAPLERTGITINRYHQHAGAYLSLDACTACTPALIASLEQRLQDEIARNEQRWLDAQRADAEQGAPGKASV